MRENRTLLFMPEYVMGGAETQFRYLIDYAERTGWKLDVIIEHRFWREDILLGQDKARMKNVRFYELGGCGNEQERVILYTLLHILKNILRVRYSACLIQHAPDIVLVPVLRSFGMYVVYSERVDASNISREHCWKKCLQYCNRILANSVHAQKELEKVTGKKVGLIRNGRPFVPQLTAKVDRALSRLLVPARIVPHKNQLLLLRYLKEYPDFTGKMVFAGAVEDRGYQRKMERFVHRNGLGEQVEFLGYVENMQAEYEKADLVVLPSLAEGTPNVVLEAYSYGRPIIVSDIKAEREVVCDSRLRFNPCNPADVHNCIGYIRNLSDRDYSLMIEKNREVILKNYNLKKMVMQYYKILTEKK